MANEVPEGKAGTLAALKAKLAELTLATIVAWVVAIVGIAVAYWYKAGIKEVHWDLSPAMRWPGSSAQSIGVVNDSIFDESVILIDLCIQLAEPSDIQFLSEGPDGHKSQGAKVYVAGDSCVKFMSCTDIGTDCRIVAQTRYGLDAGGKFNIAVYGPSGTAGGLDANSVSVARGGFGAYHAND